MRRAAITTPSPFTHDRADRHVARRGRLLRLGERAGASIRGGSAAPRATPSARPRTTRLEPMRVHVADHPLITHKLTVLRDENTPSPIFRALVEELVTLLAYEAHARRARRAGRDRARPVATTTGVRIADPRPLVVPILRAGLGMLEGMVKLLPTAEVGFLGMVRNEETLEPTTYAERLPDDLSDRQCFVLDPMLATGGSLGAAIEFLFARGAHGRHGDLPARRPRGPRGRRGGAARPRGHDRARRPRRAAQRARLHRARARRRRRPPLRHGLDSATSAPHPEGSSRRDTLARDGLRKIFLNRCFSQILASPTSPHPILPDVAPHRAPPAPSHRVIRTS